MSSKHRRDPKGAFRDPKGPPTAAPMRPVVPKSDWKMPEEECKEIRLVYYSQIDFRV